MIPTLTVFANSPDGGRGLARDMPVRWALEEAGRAYEVRAVSFAEMKTEAHKARQPFGQIPAFEEDGLALFESGAIVLHIADGCPALLPADKAERARACWSRTSPGMTSGARALKRAFMTGWAIFPGTLARQTGWKAPSAPAT